MAGTVRLLLRVTGFKNARDVAKVWVHTEGSTWYTDDDAWYVANHDIDPDTNSLVTYVDGVPSGSEGAPCAGNRRTAACYLRHRHLRSRVALLPQSASSYYTTRTTTAGQTRTGWGCRKRA